jgi:hypothetical protein
MAWLALPIVALLLLAAHFLRAEDPGLAVAATLLAALAFVRRPWAARVLQAALVLGALEWLRVAVALATERHAAGMPFARLAIILGGVCLVTAVAALVIETRRLKAHFRRGP